VCICFIFAFVFTIFIVFISFIILPVHYGRFLSEINLIDLLNKPITALQIQRVSRLHCVITKLLICIYFS